MADVTMPQLGETVTEGTVTRWLKQVGDAVALDEPLVEISTDKVDTELPSPVAGVLQSISANEGDVVQVGELLAVVGDGAAAPTPAPAAAPPAAAPAPAAAAPAAPAPAPAPAATPEPQPQPAAPAPAPPAPPPAAPAPAAGRPSTEENRLLSPVVRRLVQENGLDPSTIEGTGAGGRITREDVMKHLERPGAAAPALAAPAPMASPAPAAPAPAAAPAAAPAPPPAARPAAPAVSVGQRDDTVKLSKIRRLTGEHMIMSKAVSPHTFSVVEIDYANVDVTRNAHKDQWKAAEGFSLTYLPFIVRAVVDAIADYANMNASINGDELVVHKYVDMGIAVDLDYMGLIVPVVRDADSKRLRAIAREINDLATRARNRRLSPDEIQGGTFTISNNGSAGSVLTAAIINQPQVAILSTDAIKRRPVVVELPGGGEGIGIHSVGNLAMSWDHRAFDGAYAANFLVRIKDILETRQWDAEL